VEWDSLLYPYGILGCDPVEGLIAESFAQNGLAALKKAQAANHLPVVPLAGTLAYSGPDMKLYRNTLFAAQSQDSKSLLQQVKITPNTAAKCDLDTVYKEHPDRYGADLIIVSKFNEGREEKAAVIRIQIKMGRQPANLKQLNKLVDSGWKTVRGCLTMQDGTLAGMADDKIEHYPVWVAATPPGKTAVDALAANNVALLTGQDLWSMCIPAVQLLVHDHRLYCSAYRIYDDDKDRTKGKQLAARMQEIRTGLQNGQVKRKQRIRSTCNYERNATRPDPKETDEEQEGDHRGE